MGAVLCTNKTSQPAGFEARQILSQNMQKVKRLGAVLCTSKMSQPAGFEARQSVVHNMQTTERSASAVRCLAQALGMRVQEGGSVAQQYAQGIVGSLVGGAPGSSIYGFGNNRGNGESADPRCNFALHGGRRAC